MKADIDDIVEGLNNIDVARWLAGDAQVKGDQNARAKGDDFGLKDSVRVERLSTDLAVAPSVHLFS